MKFHSSIAMTVVGAAFLAFAAAPPAFAKKDKSAGSYSVSCLSNDSGLCAAEGGTYDTNSGACQLPSDNTQSLCTNDGGTWDSSKNTCSLPYLVNVSVTPATLWPPNHKMEVESFWAAPARTLGNTSVSFSAWFVNLTDDQTDLDGAGGQSCGQKTAKQGEDWSPDISASTPSADNSETYLVGTANLSDSNPSQLTLAAPAGGTSTPPIALRRERCAKEGDRLYTISVVCCDTTNGVCDDSAFENSPPPSSAPSPTQDLDVTVPKNRGHHHHHGKP